MRLGTLFLTGALALSTPGLRAQALALGAQAPAGLPWKTAAALPWQMGAQSPPPGPCAAQLTQSTFTLAVHIAQDGTVRITDDKGLIRLRTGLPGRPLKAWRDWGTPVLNLAADLPFSTRSPLQRGIGGLPVGAPDFRPALEGLLWILDDDESILTVIHPATSQVVYLPLPGSQHLSLAFHPDRLEVTEAAPAGATEQAVASWSLHWLALLPQFIQLGKDRDAGRPVGTALLPYPKD